MNTAAVEELLREAIGLDVSTIGRGVLERALRRQFAARADEEPAEWARRLRAEPELLRRVIEEMVVPETWFFRDGKAFEVLAGEAVKRRGRGRPLRVLSLPCATGEEAWTIAITLREAGFAPGDFTVSGRDVSVAATSAARRGTYGKNSFRGGVGDWRARWLEPAGEGWRIGEALRAGVDFAEANIFASRGPGDPFDFVFCRNLLIYFDTDMQAEALRRLRALLAADGLLFVGHSEASAVMRAGFQPWPAPRSFAFTPAPKAENAPSSPPARAAARAAARPASRAARCPAPAPMPFADVRAPAAVPVAAPANGPSLAEAVRLADRGELAAAEALAEAHLRRHGPDAEAFYLLGLVRDATGDVGAAEAAYRKALYLMPGHAHSLAHLARLLDLRGGIAEARRLRERAARGGDA